MIALLVVIVWGISGPLFAYSDTSQLVINTGTTIVIFLMVFLIQNSQNRDTVAMQAKLDDATTAVSRGVAEVRLVRGSDPDIVTRVFAGENEGTAILAGA